MAFSLSPSVEVRERDLSISIPNLPSAKTGMVLRAESGPANKIIPITSEADLITWFGKPTVSNYQDWFQAWNFLQYAASLYVVRAIDTAVGNAGFMLSGDDLRTSTTEYNLYNPDQAELTLQGELTQDRLAFYNRYVTPKQTVGFAVCSGSQYWKAPIANEFFGIVRPDATSATDINELGGVDGTGKEIALTGGNISLVAGSKFIGNGGKLFTVKNVYTDKILVNGNVSQGDISLYVFTPTASTIATNVAVGSTVDINIDTTKRTNIALDAIFVIGGCQFFVTGNAAGVLTLTKINGTGTATFAVTTTEMYSNSEYYFFQPSTDYSNGTDYVIPAGTSTIKVEAGFNFPVGSVVKLDGSGTTYVDLPDGYPDENGTDVDNYPVIAIDKLNNTITLDRPLTKDVVILVDTKIVDVAIIGTGLRGINLYSTMFDDALIVKKAESVVDADGITGASIIIKESLVPFNGLFDYEPNWVADEFVTVVLKKNTSGKFELVEKQLASYRATARDVQNKNIFGNEVFFYNSKYMYCYVNTDESIPKVNTASMSLVKFVNDFGTPTIDFQTGDLELTLQTYGTVYPLKAGTTAGMLAVDAKGSFMYDANNYKVADIQFATVPFADAEAFDVNILIAPQLDANIMSTIAETRKDCVAIVSPYDFSKLVGKQASEATASLLSDYGTQTQGADIFTTFGTYTAIYGNMKYQYDKYNDVNRWICVSGDIAGLYAQTDTNRDPWWAVAGLERGKIKNAIKLAFNATKQNRDELYVNAINPIISIAGEGSAIVYGQKTATAKPSALDRLNVRRLMIVVEKAIATAVKYALFEFNDAFTRSRLVGMIDPFLRTVKARRGVYDYYVQCDSANNPPSVLDANGLVIDVYIKPTRVAEFITINFNILRSDANITEFIGGAGA